MALRGLIVASLLLAATPCLAAEVEVSIDNFTFKPAVVTIHVGDSVVWKNGDDIPHTVTEKDINFHSEALDTGDSFTYIFTTPGEITYFCALHPHMTAKVIVLP